MIVRVQKSGVDLTALQLAASTSRMHPTTVFEFLLASKMDRSSDCSPFYLISGELSHDV
jgi:hypothetical protein